MSLTSKCIDDVQSKKTYNNSESVIGGGLVCKLKLFTLNVEANARDALNAGSHLIQARRLNVVRI